MSWSTARMSDGFNQYKLSEDGKKWVPDEEGQRMADEHEKNRRDLYWALRSRPLTDAEMAEVVSYDYSLCVNRGQPYNENEKRREFSDALLQQFKLRIAAQSTKLDHEQTR